MTLKVELRLTSATGSAPVAQERPLAGTSLAAVQGVGGAREIPGGLIVDPSSSAGIKRKLEAQQGR